MTSTRPKKMCDKYKRLFLISARLKRYVKEILKKIHDHWNWLLISITSRKCVINTVLEKLVELEYVPDQFVTHKMLEEFDDDKLIA